MEKILDALVVGAGPSGLMMANLLQRSGIALRVIDQNAGRATESRALVVHAKSMELFQNLGVAEEFLAAARSSLGLEIFSEGEKRASVEFSDIGVDDSPFPSVYFLPQSQTEQILEDFLTKNGNRVERSTELVSFRQEKDFVEAVVRRGEVEETVRCRYLLGCDGAHSAVRHGLQLAFEGAAYPQDFFLADVRIEWPHRPDHFQLFLGSQGLLVHFPLSKTHGRLVIAGSDVGSRQEEPDLAEIQRLTEKFSGGPVKLSDPLWVTRFRLHHRGVRNYRVGRAFLVGDAAHIHSPAGGQGMNTGLQDAANLAWKLVAVIKNGAPDALLDTYQGERHRIGQILLKTTDRFFAFATVRNPVLNRVRNAFLPRIAKFVFSKRSRRKAAFRRISQLSIRYHDHAFQRESLIGADREFLRAPGAGRRAPDAKIGLSTLFERLTGPGAKLLVLAQNEDADFRSRATALAESFPQLRPVFFQATPETSELYARYGVKADALYFVRPDGYIGFRSYGKDTSALASFLGSFNGSR